MTGLVGLTGMLGSVGWFTAMTIQNAAYVRALFTRGYGVEIGAAAEQDEIIV